MNIKKTNPYRERIIAGLSKLLNLTALLTFASGLIIPFSVKSQLLALLGWGMSWAFTYQLLYAVSALDYNPDYPLWHQKEGIRKIRLWASIIVYNTALVTEMGRVWGNLPFAYLEFYDNYSGTLCLAVLSWLIYWLGNAAQPSEADIRMARIEANVQAMRCQTHIPTPPSPENAAEQAADEQAADEQAADEQAAAEQAAAEQAAAEQAAAEQAAAEQAAAEQAAPAKKTMLLHRIGTVAGIAATAAITAAVILWFGKKEKKE